MSASIAIVAPGPIVAARRPASAGPMIQPTLNTASKIALARATCDRPTSPGTDAVYAASHSTRSTSIGKVTRRMSAIVGPSSPRRSG